MILTTELNVLQPFLAENAELNLLHPITEIARYQPKYFRNRLTRKCRSRVAGTNNGFVSKVFAVAFARIHSPCAAVKLLK